MLNRTPTERMLDGHGRPYFLWDCDLTLDDFRARLTAGSQGMQNYLIAKLMRQARPDDVFQFVSLRDIRTRWKEIEPLLGHAREFWTWLLETVEEQRHARR